MPVTEVFVTPEREVLDLALETEDGAAEQLRVTPEHPFWSLDDGGWDAAGGLDIGEVVDTLSGPMRVAASFALPGVETVYNFEVEGSHTYFVGESGVWVHNACDVPFTRAMHARSEVIAAGRKIRKVDELVDKFGGRARDWIKKKTWDETGREIHYYEHHGIGRVGTKWAGEVDPF